MADRAAAEFDVAIVGGGPAGLSAALLLGRCRRRVVLFDHGQYRNYAASAVNGYLNLDGIHPTDLRDRGRKEATAYGVRIETCEVASAECCSDGSQWPTAFKLETKEASYEARAVILSTGVQDALLEIPGLRELYGQCIHHCPFCDGWEHRDQRLVALGRAASAAKLAITLREWSEDVVACSNGEPFSPNERRQLAACGVPRDDRVVKELRSRGASHELIFESGDPRPFDAMFFSADQSQAGKLPVVLGCKTADDGLIQTNDKQGVEEDGLFVAGDIHSDVQMAIVASAEGAIAATAVNKMLIKQDMKAKLAAHVAAER